MSSVSVPCAALPESVERDEHGDTPDLVPARILNEHVYCPRLSYLEWVQGEFAESADTLEGARTHRRVDHPRGRVPPPDAGEEGQRIHSTSVYLSARELGVVCVIDLIESDEAVSADGRRAVIPVDYKKGQVPDNPERSWEADRVQLCSQALVLRENGYRVASGVLYYAASKTRVDVVFDEVLCARTSETVRAVREMAESRVMPQPLADSPKCPRCSLVGICLPDETRLLRSETPTGETATSQEARPVRPIVPSRDDRRALYVQEQGATIRKKDAVIQVAAPKTGQSLAEIRLLELSQVCLFGNIQITTQALQALRESDIPVVYFSMGGWFHGMTQGLPSKNIELRMRQFAVAGDRPASLQFAREIVAGKIENQRTLLRRNHEQPDPTTLREMKELSARALEAPSAETLLGLEGNAARLYFQSFPGLLRPRGGIGRHGRVLVRLRDPQPPASDRPGQRAPVVRVLAAGQGSHRHLLGRRPGPVSRVLPQTALR